MPVSKHSPFDRVLVNDCKCGSWISSSNGPAHTYHRHASLQSFIMPPSAPQFCSCSGASGFVQLALDTETDEQVAIKFIERGGRTSQRIIARELLNHRECAMHPHIVQLKVQYFL